MHLEFSTVNNLKSFCSIYKHEWCKGGRFDLSKIIKQQYVKFVSEKTSLTWYHKRPAAN